MDKTTRAKLKAFFAAQLFRRGDLYGPAYSTMTDGDLEGFSLETINKLIDEFKPEEIN